MLSFSQPQPVHSRIVGVGYESPERVVTNDELSLTLDTSDEWITSRVGIRERRLAADGQSVTDLAAAAGVKALLSADVHGTDIDMVIVATMTAMDRSPSTAAQVATRIGAAHPVAFDLNAACAGFSQALAVADQAIRAGSASRALIIGAERMSDFMDWTDRTTAILMADGAGAVVLERSETAGVAPVAWGSQPELGNLVRIQQPSGRFEQEGRSVFRWAITQAQHVAIDALAKGGVRAEDLVAFVPHQANLRIIDALGKQLGLADEVVARDVVYSGNTSAASIPIALAKQVEAGVAEPGGPALLLGFGGGFCYSGQVIAFPEVRNPA